jgi:tetratricopeptide (TPR) repeat protein
MPGNADFAKRALEACDNTPPGTLNPEERTDLDLIRGLAHFRLGNFPLAETTLRAVPEAPRAPGQGQRWPLHIPRKAVLAMCLYRLGRKAEAEELYAQTRRQYEKLVGPGVTQRDVLVINSLMCRILLREAHELIRGEPDADQHVRFLRSAMFAQLGDRAKAEAELAAAEKGQMYSAENGYAWWARGAAHARLGRLSEAAAAYKKAMERRPNDAGLASEAAGVLILAGDEAAYRKLCDRLLEQFGKTDKVDGTTLTTQTNSPVYEGYLTARACILDAKGHVDARRVEQLAAHVFKRDPDVPWYAHTLAVTHYRAEAFERAIAQAKVSLKLEQADYTILDWLVLAMAHQRLGQTTDARRWLDQANAWMRANRRAPGTVLGAFPLPPRGDLECQLLHREAESLLGKQLENAPTR